MTQADWGALSSPCREIKDVNANNGVKSNVSVVESKHTEVVDTTVWTPVCDIKLIKNKVIVVHQHYVIAFFKLKYLLQLEYKIYVKQVLFIYNITDFCVIKTHME